MKRIYFIKTGTDLLPYLMAKLNQVHVPKKKRAIMKAGTDLVLIYSKGKCLVQRADIRTPYRHMIFTFNITDWDKYIYPMEISCLSTQGFITTQVDGLGCTYPDVSEISWYEKEHPGVNVLDVYGHSYSPQEKTTKGFVIDVGVGFRQFPGILNIDNIPRIEQYNIPEVPQEYKIDTYKNK